MQQQQQQQYQSAQPQYNYQQQEQEQPSAEQYADINQEAAQFAQSQQLKYQHQQAATPSQRIQYSPSNEVSHVKYTSGDLSYNF